MSPTPPQTSISLDPLTDFPFIPRQASSPVPHVPNSLLSSQPSLSETREQDSIIYDVVTSFLDGSISKSDLFEVVEQYVHSSSTGIDAVLREMANRNVPEIGYCLLTLPDVHLTPRLISNVANDCNVGFELACERLAFLCEGDLYRGGLDFESRMIADAADVVCSELEAFMEKPTEDYNTTTPFDPTRAVPQAFSQLARAGAEGNYTRNITRRIAAIAKRFETKYALTRFVNDILLGVFAILLPHTASHWLSIDNLLREAVPLAKEEVDIV